ncbi:hypothetical protein SPICUR_09085 [Spiribacter curvatus]|uniref:Uncharacterized protein n=1 Tax=Spiribacter curvatus TaxID=1335757 RepID=U5T8J6_9GAMM|nr:hypothetical protein SPICUR_09085 [Spiribacter curvatus]
MASLMGLYSTSRMFMEDAECITRILHAHQAGSPMNIGFERGRCAKLQTR